MVRITISSLRTLPVRPPLGRRAAGAFTVPGTVRGSTGAAVVRSGPGASLVVARTGFLLVRLSYVAISGDNFNVVLARGIALRSTHEGLVLRMVDHGRCSVGCVER